MKKKIERKALDLKKENRFKKKESTKRFHLSKFKETIKRKKGNKFKDKENETDLKTGNRFKENIASENLIFDI